MTPLIVPSSQQVSGGPVPLDVSLAIFTIDATLRITGWSPAAAGVTGYTAAEMVGQSMAALFPPDWKVPGLDPGEPGRSVKGRTEVEGWLVQKSGERIWVQTILTALRDEDSGVVGYVCQARDLTGQRAAEERRRAKSEQLAALAVTREDIATYGLELAALLPRLAMRARRLTAADAAVLELREGSGDKARAHDGATALDLPLRSIIVPHGGATAGARLRCVRYDAHHESPEVLGDVCDRAGARSILAIPIIHDRATIGWLAVLSAGPNAFTDQHASTLELMSMLLGGPIAQAQAADARRSLATERTRAQAAQRESEARFRAAMDASLDALFILGAIRDAGNAIVDFTLLDENRRAEELCGLPREECTGRRLSEVPTVAGQLASADVLASVVQSRVPLERERQAVDVTGAVTWIQEQIVPLGDGATVTVRDVTARVEADALMRRAREAAEAANRAKTDFVARMSHELRTPLNSVIGFSNILLRNKRSALNESELTYLTRISTAGTHLLALINDVLDIAKVEAGHMDFELGDVDVVALTRGVIAQLDAAAHTAGLTVALDAPPEPMLVVADVGRFQQVLLNVVGNAIKFTPAGRVTVRITGDPGAAGPRSVRRRIEVSDTGIGIASDRLSAVFDAFEQAESSTSRRYGGTGLGLSFSRALCEAMGFQLTVSSELGTGSTFRIELPDAPAPDDP
jgi:PAS domain S-box-containing protein